MSTANVVRTNLGALYDPLTNSWTSMAPPPAGQNIGDANAAVLSNGVFIQANCCSQIRLLDCFNARDLSWTEVVSYNQRDWNESGWTSLPDGRILTVVGCTGDAYALSPVTGLWTNVGPIPVTLPDCGKSWEYGPQVLRPDRTLVAFGATTCGSGCGPNDLSVTTHTAIFDSKTSTWTKGTDLPTVVDEFYGAQNMSSGDSPAVLLPNGKVLFAAAANYQFWKAAPHFFEMSSNASGNQITQVAPPTLNAHCGVAGQWAFLALPSGQILATAGGGSIYLYTPTGAPDPAWAPTVTSVPTALIAGGPICSPANN